MMCGCGELVVKAYVWGGGKSVLEGDMGVRVQDHVLVKGQRTIVGVDVVLVKGQTAVLGQWGLSMWVRDGLESVQWPVLVYL